MTDKQHILYIEDDADQLALVQAWLELHLPVLVDACSSAGGAELLLNSRCYDLIISDVNLPIVFGTEILEKVLERDPGQPVMLLSEYTCGKTKEEANRISVPLQPKFSTFESKDFTAFLDRIRELLQKRPCAANTPASNLIQRRLLTPIKLISDNVTQARSRTAGNAFA